MLLSFRNIDKRVKKRFMGVCFWIFARMAEFLVSVYLSDSNFDDLLRIARIFLHPSTHSL